MEIFTNLPFEDRTSLLKENAGGNWLKTNQIFNFYFYFLDLLVSLRGAIFFDSRKKGVNQVLISMGIGKHFHLLHDRLAKHSFLLDDMETIKTMFAPLMEREKSLNHIEYSNFNSIQKVLERLKKVQNQLLH